MSTKLGGAVVGAILILLTAQGCVFGGDDGGSGGPLSRPGAVPTATLPATLQDPILLGQVQTTSGGTNTTGGASAGTYVIKSGDTLGGVATSLGVPPEQQAAWIAEVLRLNNITDARTLGVGVELTLPRIATATSTPRTTGTPGTPQATPNRTTTPGAATTPQATTSAATSTPTVRPTSSGSSSGRTYTVVSGDTPLVIADKLNVPSAQQAAWANELIALNGINPSSMQVGDVLDLPAGTP
ncbi:MAG: LysM peptidoglycan-binding domain-containing protein [Dehalococcoidia bacterium]